MPNEILKIIADNPALMSALRETIESKFTLDTIDTNMTNEAMGQVARARISGLEKIDKAFKEIEKYRSFAEKTPERNPAR